MNYPDKIKVRFRPTDELIRYRGHGIDTNRELVWDVPRAVAMYLILHFSGNWRIEPISTDKSNPLVSAVMPTCYGREKMAIYAVKQFERQTWPNKELVIINEGDHWLLRDLKPGITEIRVRPGRYLNGGLRNIGDSVARGDYIIRWDDDDIHHPDRIRIQIESALATHSPASTLSARIHYLLEDDIAFIRNMTSVGLLLYANEGKRYEESIVGGSDEVFYRTHYADRCCLINNTPDIYTRIYHGGNICTRHHISCGRQDSPGSWEVGDWRHYLRRAIEEYRRAIA